MTETQTAGIRARLFAEIARLEANILRGKLARASRSAL